jgi:hypothetical protein
LFEGNEVHTFDKFQQACRLHLLQMVPRGFQRDEIRADFGDLAMNALEHLSETVVVGNAF